jgi:hypothetical protein
MRKTVPMTMPKIVTAADSWVKATPCAPGESMKRFTIDVPADLHVRIKTRCASRGEKMADVLRALLAREFPE